MNAEDFATLFELLPIGAYRTTPDGRQVRANPALVRINGYASEAEMLAAVNDLGTEWYVEPARREEFKALMLSQGRVVDFVSEIHRHKTRERIWIREHAHAVRDAKGQTLFFEGTVEDITASQQAQQQLRESEARFRSLTDLSAHWYWEQDSEFRFTRFASSSRSKMLFGEEALGKTRWDIGASNLSPAQWQAHRDTLLAHQPFHNLELRREHPKTGVYWLSANGMPRFGPDGSFAGYHGVGWDITAAKLAEQELMRNKEILDGLLQTIPDAVWLKDADGVYLACNAAFERRWAVPASAVIGQTEEQLLGAQRAREYADTDRMAIEAGRAFLFEESYVRADDASEVICEIVKTPMRDRDGRIIGVLGMARDITERKRAETQLRDTSERLELAIISAELGMWDQSLRGDQPLHLDPRACALLGSSPADFPSDEDWIRMIHPEDVAGMRAARNRHLRGELPSYEVEFRLRHVDGHWIWLQCCGKVVQTSPEGEQLRMVGTLLDISRRKLAEGAIRQMAFHDSLTELPNRRLLMDRLNQALTATRRHKQFGALLFLDLDQFKQVNDALGHETGDLLLQQVAARMSASVRAVDTVARIGGDEFVVLIENLSASRSDAQTQAAGVGNKVLAALNEPYALGAHQHFSTPSIGATLFEDNGMTPSDVLKQADLAMYEAKANGRNSLCFYNPSPGR